MPGYVETVQVDLIVPSYEMFDNSIFGFARSTGVFKSKWRDWFFIYKIEKQSERLSLC